MLSALAKYIFGGIMGDAPETTPMQYETRELNDWLLVDMPDQAIDDEDMDSETDDDDILTAVPLLMTEEVSVYPRQILLSCEANSICDKSYGKIRKDFHDKIHSPSSKVQVHSGDKIQGNFVDNVEAISVEDNFHNTIQNNSTNVQDNSKSKKSKSKKSKPKKSKKTRIQNKCYVKMQNTTATVKDDCNNVQEIANGNIQHNSNDKTQPTLCEIPDNSSSENINMFVNKTEDISFAVPKNSTDRIQDICEIFPEMCNNEISENFDLDVQENLVSKIPSNSSEDISEIKTESISPIEIYKERISETTDIEVQDLFEDCRNSDIEEKNNLEDQAEIINEDKIQAIDSQFKGSAKKSKSKKCKSKKFKKSKIHDKFVKYQDISTALQSKSNNLSEYSDENIVLDFDNKNQSIFVDKIEDTATAVTENCDVMSQNTFVVGIQDDSIAVHESSDDCENDDHKDFDNIHPMFPEVQYNSFQDNIIDEASLTITEQSNDIIKNNDAKNEDTCFRNQENCNDEFLEHSNKVPDEFDHKILFMSSDVHKNSNDENQDYLESILAEVENDYQNKNQDSFGFQENCNDRIMDNFANLWDIYTKIQENSDDEAEEISDDEMDEVLNEELQETSDHEMNDHSDDEKSIDEKMIENSDDEAEISNDEIYGRPCDKILQLLFGEIKSKPYNSVFQLSPEEESEEESDNEIFADIENSFIFPATKVCTADKNNFTELPRDYNFLENLNSSSPQISKHHTGCIPYSEYELAEYFSFEPGCFYACQSLHYPSSYALAVAEFYANHFLTYQKKQYARYSECCKMYTQKYEKRSLAENSSSDASIDPSLITNSAELLQNIIIQKCTVLPTKTAVVLEHVKELKPVQQAIQLETRKYLTRSQLNRQNRNYIYQSSVKNNRRRNLQRNHSGANNNRKCC